MVPMQSLMVDPMSRVYLAGFLNKKRFINYHPNSKKLIVKAGARGKRSEKRDSKEEAAIRMRSR